MNSRWKQIYSNNLIMDILPFYLTMLRPHTENTASDPTKVLQLSNILEPMTWQRQKPSSTKASHCSNALEPMRQIFYANFKLYWDRKRFS
jgi:hypothetical protein